MKAFLRPLILLGVGGFVYVIIELLWRGYSHWTMFLVGGLCFVLIGEINNWFTFEMPLVQQMAIGSVIITVVEFIAGCIINLQFHLNVWDYSHLPFNILGQVCLPFMFLWFLLCVPGILLDDYLRYHWFGEEKPHYHLFKSTCKK